MPKFANLFRYAESLAFLYFIPKSVRESSGIDLLTKTHKILPKSREERIKKRPICVRGSWDADIVDDIKPTQADHIVLKRRDSAFHDTEIAVWLRSLSVNTIIFCGIDTSICVETSLRDAFNIGYDIVLISDATASSNEKHYESTLDNVRGYYGLVMDLSEFSSHLISSKSNTIVERRKMESSTP